MKPVFHANSQIIIAQISRYAYSFLKTACKILKIIYNRYCVQMLRTLYNVAWLSLVERCVRDAEVASSNLVATTFRRSAEAFEIQGFRHFYSCYTNIYHKNHNKRETLYQTWLILIRTLFIGIANRKRLPQRQSFSVCFCIILIILPEHLSTDTFPHHSVLSHMPL